MRLRILDLNTPWFWLTVFFYGKRYGSPSLEIALWQPHKWCKWWLHAFQREPIPSEGGGYEVVPDTAAA